CVRHHTGRWYFDVW
nr:immunoglobulin heavy chain junction region [Mus musculus]